MPTFQDLHIFVTGVVGRAMGSGKFEPEQIPVLCEAAYNAFKLTFGEPDSAPRAAPQRLTDIMPPEVAAPAKSYGAPVAQEPAAVDGKPFRVWANDKIKLGKKIGPGNKPWGEVTWAEAHQHLARGSAQVRGYLSFLANLADKDPQYAASNARMRGRAQSLLDSIPEQSRDETPFG